MDPRTRWLNLHDYLRRARVELDRGAPSEALPLVDAALRLDPEFLAARALRATIIEQSAFESPAERPRAAPGTVPPRPQPPECASELWLNPEARHADSVDLRPGGAPPRGRGARDVLPFPESFSGASRVPSPALEPALRPLAETAIGDGSEGWVDRRLAEVRAKMARGHLAAARSALNGAQQLSPERMDVSLLFAELAVLEQRQASSAVRWMVMGVGALLLVAAAWHLMPFDNPGTPRLAEPALTDLPLAVATAPRAVPPAPADTPTPPPADTTPQELPRLQPAPPSAVPPPVPPTGPPVSLVPLAPELIEPSVPSGLSTFDSAIPSLFEGLAPSAPSPAAPTVTATTTESPPAMSSTAAPVSALVPIPAPIDDERLVRETLQRYRAAYDALDAASAQAVWPAVNRSALARAFADLSVQQLRFDSCAVSLHGGAGNATCRGTARYVPRVGARDEKIESRVWTFALRKDGARWLIDTARVEPLRVTAR